MRRIIDKRNKEKFQIDDIYLNGWAKKCGIHATGVYMVMCRHCNKEQECFPSKRLIANKLAISERSVYSAINKLKEYNIVEVINQGRKKTGEFLNLTYILLDKSEWKSPSANCAVGKLCSQPSANCAVNRRHVVPKKDTHNKKDTHIKETHPPKGGKKITSYGNPIINSFINFLKNAIGASLDGTQRENRQYVNLLIRKFEKDYPDKVPADLIKALIVYGLKDKFHAQNITNFKYLYYNSQKIIQAVKAMKNNYIKL